MPWDFFGGNDTEAGTPILWPPHAKSWVIGRLWCWEGLGAGGEGDDRGWDGWMASLTWTWVWVNSRSWWWAGRPGVLRFMGLQRVGHDWATELNWGVPQTKKKTCQFKQNNRNVQPMKYPEFITCIRQWMACEKTNSKGNCLEQKTNRKYFKSPKLQMQINRLWNHMLGNAPVKGKEEETKLEAWRIRCLRLLPALACSPAEHSAPGLIHSVPFMEAGELLGLT